MNQGSCARRMHGHNFGTDLKPPEGSKFRSSTLSSKSLRKILKSCKSHAKTAMALHASSPSSALLIGLSGPSSSGKTTLARLLRTIFQPNLLILHQDDFYRPEAELPVRHGLRDWDCAEAIDIPAFLAALSFIRAHGRLPDDLVSKEDQNAVGDSGVSDEDVEELKAQVQARTTQRGLVCRSIVLVDGFLLFGSGVPEIREMFDLKMMLRTSYEVAKTRREARTGYVTLEGFWEDPPGYVDFIVWPAYVREHKFLFLNEDVEADVEETRATELDLNVCPGKDSWTMKDVTHWASNLVVVKQLELCGRHIGG